jgi:hypothetical protein
VREKRKREYVLVDEKETGGAVIPIFALFAVFGMGRWIVLDVAFESGRKAIYRGVLQPCGVVLSVRAMTFTLGDKIVGVAMSWRTTDASLGWWLLRNKSGSCLCHSAGSIEMISIVRARLYYRFQ